MSPLPDPRAIMAAHATISARIRALAAAGYSRSQIKDLVDRSYQQVRQVLVDEEKRLARRGPAKLADRSGVEEDSAAFTAPPSKQRPRSQRLQLDSAGRLSLGPALMQTLGVCPGGVVMALCDSEGVVTLMSARTAMLQAQAIVNSVAPPGASLVDELLAERRAEAARENGDD